MFKLFHCKHDGSSDEVLAQNGTYVVYEIYYYKIVFHGVINTTEIFIEDEAVDDNVFIFDTSLIITKENKKFFEDYFGYLTLTINGEKFTFEVRIQKLKVPELEEILLYLWNQEPLIFNNLLSKSTVKSRLSSENTFSDFSSKFVNVFEDFFCFFKQQLFTFRALPHYYLRSRGVIKEYQDADISTDSIEWLLNNLDELEIGVMYRDMENAVRLGNKYGVIDSILSRENVADYNTYENQIVLGGFEYVIQQISEIKAKIEKLITIKQTYENEYYSINQFKILPFVKLKNDITKVDIKLKSLFSKYKDTFSNTDSRNSFPKLTTVFAKKKHYFDSYKKIRLIRDIRFNIDGELNLLNVKKISTLYERFNLFVIINFLHSKKPNYFHREGLNDDGIYSRFIFQFDEKIITVYFDQNVGTIPNDIGLQRISNGTSYRPDHILKQELKGKIEYVIFDSKYSTETTVKGRHLPKCINKYILDIGITGQPTCKINSLLLLYPGESESIIFGSNEYGPIIGILPSKVNKNSIDSFLEKSFFTV